MSALPFDSNAVSTLSDYWDQVAEDYPALYSLLYKKKKLFDRRLVADGLALINLRGDSTLLDAGCGKGADVAYFAHKDFARVIGVDHSVGMLADAYERIAACHEPEVSAKIQFLEEDIRHIDLADASVDVACSFSTIDHIPTATGRMQAIDELTRLTVAGGLIVLTFPNRDGLASRLKTCRDLYVSPRRIGDRDVVWLEDRGGHVDQPEYQIEKTYGWDELASLTPDGALPIKPIQIASGVMTDCLVVNSVEEAESAGLADESCDILVNRVQTLRARGVVERIIDEWRELGVARRGLRIGMVALRL